MPYITIDRGKLYKVSYKQLKEIEKKYEQHKKTYGEGNTDAEYEFSAWLGNKAAEEGFEYVGDILFDFRI
jgi:hypothetical protein